MFDSEVEKSSTQSSETFGSFLDQEDGDFPVSNPAHPKVQTKSRDEIGLNSFETVSRSQSIHQARFFEALLSPNKLKDSDHVLAKLVYLFDKRIIPPNAASQSLENLAVVTQLVMISVVFVATASCCMQTQKEYDPTLPENSDIKQTWQIIDHICFGLFAAEYVLRLWCAIAVDELRDFLTSFMNAVDVACIVPFYLHEIFGGGVDTRYLRVVRLSRITSIFKSARFGNIGEIVTMIVKGSLAPMMIPVFFMSLAAIVVSCLMYHVEYVHSSDPVMAMQQPFYSIPQALWWSMVTFTTVGYGDLYPETSAGRLVCVMTMGMGVFFMAMPVAIVGNSFQTTWEELQDKATMKDVRKRVESGDLSVDEQFLNSKRLTIESLVHKLGADLRDFQATRPDVEHEQYQEVFDHLDKFDASMRHQWQLYHVKSDNISSKKLGIVGATISSDNPLADKEVPVG